MTLSTTLVLAENTSSNRGVCLSDRDVQIAITAMDYIQNRYVWDEMSDLAWDELEGYISSAIDKILSIDTCGGGVSVATIGAKISRTTVQSKVSADTKIIFDAEIFDTDNMSDLVTNDDRITIVADGYYQVVLNVELTGTGSTEAQRSAQIWLNGTFAQQTFVATPRGLTIQCVAVLSLVSGDYIQAYFGTTLSAGINNASLSVIGV